MNRKIFVRKHDQRCDEIKVGSRSYYKKKFSLFCMDEIGSSYDLCKWMRMWMKIVIIIMATNLRKIKKGKVS